MPAHGKLYDGTGTGGHLITAAEAGVAGGYVVADAAGKVMFDPDLNYNNTSATRDSFTFKVSDGFLAFGQRHGHPRGECRQRCAGMFKWQRDNNEDSALNGTLSCTDADGNNLTYSRVANAAHGSVTVNADGTFSYTPAANYNGPDGFTYTISDGNGGSTPRPSLTVTSVNDPPDCGRRHATTVAEDSTANVVRRAGQRHRRGQPGRPANAGLTVVDKTKAAHGTVVSRRRAERELHAGGELLRHRRFTYTISDDGRRRWASDTATVTSR